MTHSAKKPVNTRIPVQLNKDEFEGSVAKNPSYDMKPLLSHF